MEYKVNDIFCSLQGEGNNTGRAAVFVRFAGCNLRCPFCDTSFDTFRVMTAEGILDAVSCHPTRFIVLTGGEPTLQVDSLFVDRLHERGYEVAMESNATRPAPDNIDWLTLSPKGRVADGITRCNELKIVYVDDESVNDYGIKADHYYLQPCDTGDEMRNRQIVKNCIDYIQQHPRWRLSLQMHKLAGIK